MPASGHALVIKYGFRGLPGLILGIAYLLSIVTGVYGFFESPPAAVAAIIGFSVISVIWNCAFIFAGIVGVIARRAKAPRTEIVAVETIALIMDLWALMTFVTPQSNQAGLALITLSLLLFGWASGTRAYLNHKEKELSAFREA